MFEDDISLNYVGFARILVLACIVLVDTRATQIAIKKTKKKTQKKKHKKKTHKKRHKKKTQKKDTKKRQKKKATLLIMLQTRILCCTRKPGVQRSEFNTS